MFRIGLRTKKRIVKASPPKRKVIKPPETLIPEIAWEIMKIEKALNKVFLKSDFIVFL